MFSCEFCEIYKDTFSYRRPPVAASVFNANTITKRCHSDDLSANKLTMKCSHVFKFSLHDHKQNLVSNKISLITFSEDALNYFVNNI